MSDSSSLDLRLQQELTIAHRTYIRALNKDLALQNPHGMFLRNVVAVHQQMLENVKALLPDMDTLLEMTELFIQQALQHNRSSCAVSNFPDEHHPGENAIVEAIASCQAQCKTMLQNA